MRILDLFSGAAGGWSLGMHRAGFRTVAACEIDPWRRQAFGRNFPEARLYDDIRGLTATRLLADLGGLPDVIVGSPPCQSFSATGPGTGLDDERGRLFFEWIRLADECRPRWCAAENSALLRTRGYDRIASELEAIGYACWPHVVEARQLGAPHERRRAFIIAADADGAAGPIRQGERRYHGEEQPAVERGAACHGPAWSAGIGGCLGAYDGVPDRLAQACADAFGDSVLPQITEAIGRAILSVEARLRLGEAA